MGIAGVSEPLAGAVEAKGQGQPMSAQLTEKMASGLNGTLRGPRRSVSVRVVAVAVTVTRRRGKLEGQFGGTNRMRLVTFVVESRRPG